MPSILQRNNTSVYQRLANALGKLINPATEEKQDDIITELKLKADLTETQPVSDIAIDSVIAELQLKANLTDTQPVSLV